MLKSLTNCFYCTLILARYLRKGRHGHGPATYRRTDLEKTSPQGGSGDRIRPGRRLGRGGSPGLGRPESRTPQSPDFHGGHRPRGGGYQRFRSHRTFDGARSLFSRRCRGTRDSATAWRPGCPARGGFSPRRQSLAAGIWSNGRVKSTLLANRRTQAETEHQQQMDDLQMKLRMTRLSADALAVKARQTREMLEFGGVSKNALGEIELDRKRVSLELEQLQRQQTRLRAAFTSRLEAIELESAAPAAQGRPAPGRPGLRLIAQRGKRYRHPDRCRGGGNGFGRARRLLASPI